MALTSKQRAQLRGLAMTEDTIIQIGKGGITENTVTQVKDALTAREAADALAEACAAETVQTIGSKFVLYKRNAKEPKIALVKEKKK